MQEMPRGLTPRAVLEPPKLGGPCKEAAPCVQAKAPWALLTFRTPMGSHTTLGFASTPRTHTAGHLVIWQKQTSLSTPGHPTSLEMHRVRS